jgi:UDP-N-acetylmuramyl pentapeptide phosphotransferase/UDP-N-acetylglucosamine-1-phosphate transferase
MLSSIVVAVAVLCAAFVAWAGARLLVRLSERRVAVLDVSCGDLRKLHTDPTPRVGGIAVAGGVLVGILAMLGATGELDKPSLLLACVAPGLVWGLIEDVTKRGDVFVRLALSAVAAAMGFVLLDARITQVDLPGLDRALQINLISFAFTVFAVTGVANAINVIDGLNGLSSVNALLASIGLAIVAWIVGDKFVFQIACILAGAVGGFLAVNFPSGRIFLGDGGAYLIGLLLALLSVILVQRNIEVSAWFPLVLLWYPIWETLYSMYRRKVRGRSTGSADALHLHTLVYRRLIRWKGPGATPTQTVLRNSLASLCLWIFPFMGFGIALAFWNHSIILQASAVVLAVVYVIAYRRIVRFRVPRWAVAWARSAAGISNVQQTAVIGAGTEDSATAEPR